MKFEQEVVQLESSKPIQSNSYAFDVKDIGIAFNAFINYSNPLGSFIREIASNSWDANVENDRFDEPVIISYKENSLYFIDKGLGISPDRMENVVKYFFKSTKRESNDQIGAWGLGSKSPLGYTDSFSMITVHNGMEYHYLISKKDNGPSIDLVDTIEVDKENGTTVIVPVRESSVDIANEIRRQLIYFHNVVYQNLGIDNSFKIQEGKTFFYSSATSWKELHIANGPVTYELKKEIIRNICAELQLEDIFVNRLINLPIGLKFSIGELGVTWNREAIQYNPKTIACIKERVVEFLEEIETYKDTINEEYLEKVFKNEYTPINSIKERIKQELNLVPTVNFGFTQFKLTVNSINTLSSYCYKTFREGNWSGKTVIKDVELKEYQIKYLLGKNGRCSRLVLLKSYDEFRSTFKQNVDQTKIKFDPTLEDHEYLLPIIYDKLVSQLTKVSQLDYPSTSATTEKDGRISYIEIKAPTAINKMKWEKVTPTETNPFYYHKDSIFVVGTFKDKEILKNLADNIHNNRNLRFILVSEDNIHYMLSLEKCIGILDFTDKIIPRSIEWNLNKDIANMFDYKQCELIKILSKKYPYFKRIDTIITNARNGYLRNNRLKLNHKDYLNTALIEELSLVINSLNLFNKEGHPIFEHIYDLNKFLNSDLSKQYMDVVQNPIYKYKQKQKT